MKIEIEAMNGDRAQLYQWDLNRRIILSGFGPDTQAHFGQDSSALVVEAYEDGGVLYADIPNICLQCAGMLHVYIYNSASTRTRTAVAISVRARPKPEDYVYTETETLTYRELEKRIAKLEESGGIDVSGAQVGQTIRVSTVDESGKPTAWEPADFPESTNDSDALEALAECGIITPAYQDGTFYTDADGTIYVL